MWTIWADWKGLLDGYRLAESRSEELQRTWSEEVEKRSQTLELEARKKHLAALEDWIEAREKQITSNVHEEMEIYPSRPDALGNGDENRENQITSVVNEEQIVDLQTNARSEGIKDRNRRYRNLVAIIISLFAAGCPAIYCPTSIIYTADPSWERGALWLFFTGSFGLIFLTAIIALFMLKKPMKDQKEEFKKRAANLSDQVRRSLTTRPELSSSTQDMTPKRNSLPELDTQFLWKPDLYDFIPQPPSLDVFSEWKYQISVKSRDFYEYRNMKHDDVVEGLDAEWDMFQSMLSFVGNGYIGIPGILVDFNLDADLLLIGPNGIWILESKYWSGTIRLNKGQWSRLQPAYNGGNTEEIDSFDDQWIRQRDAIIKALGELELPREPREIIKGGIVFTHPNVELELDGSSRVPVGRLREWKRRFFQAEDISGMDDLDLCVQIADALLHNAQGHGQKVTRSATDAVREVVEQCQQETQEFLRNQGIQYNGSLC